MTAKRLTGSCVDAGEDLRRVFASQIGFLAFAPLPQGDCIVA